MKNSSAYSSFFKTFPQPITLKGKAAKKGLKVLFTSDKKKQGSGAQCSAMCLDGVTTTPAPNTNLGRDVLKIKQLITSVSSSDHSYLQFNLTL